ncbi:MAG: glycosyltransferase [Thermoplasmata archaeon]
MFGPLGSRLPDHVMALEKVSLEPAWEYDDPIGLTKCFLKILARCQEFDAILFNIYLTSFGNGELANGLGLSIPIALGALAPNRVVVYMHNFLETSDVASLGYNPSLTQRVMVRTLEALLSMLTRVVVPLPSQVTTMRSLLPGPIQQVFVPHVDAFANPVQANRRAESPSATPVDKPVSILLFGAWGPQKDLVGVIDCLESLRADGHNFSVVVAGHVNSAFEGSADQIHRLEQRLPHDVYRFILEVPDRAVAPLFEAATLVILPYNATGGFSGVMSLASYYCVPIISYDLPGMRETATLLNIDCEFVRPRDPVSLSLAISKVACGNSRQTSSTDAPSGNPGNLELISVRSALQILGY